MLDHLLLEREGVLVLSPNAPLQQEDFATLGATVDAYLAKHEKLHGVLIHSKRFPGWEDISGFTAHLHFVREHRDKVECIALVSDSVIAGVAESLAKFFTPAEFRRFNFSEYDIALRWLRT